MAYDVPNFLKREGDKLLFNKKDHEFIFYIPEEYFSSNIAEYYGEYIYTIGICNYTIINKNTNHNIGLHPFTFPTMILTKPSNVEKIKGVKLTEDMEEDDYRVLHYEYEDEIINSVKVPKIIENVELFFKMFTITGKIPTSIPYDTLHNLFVENINLNGNDYGINMQMFGFIVSELCRDPEDLSRPFRLAKNKSMHQYIPISAKLKPNYVSPFVAITSENFDESLQASITMDENKYSPLERVLSQ